MSYKNLYWVLLVTYAVSERAMKLTDKMVILIQYQLSQYHHYSHEVNDTSFASLVYTDMHHMVNNLDTGQTSRLQ